MSSIRIPLSDFKGIDRSRITSIGLALDGQPTGSILIADLEFLSKEAVPLQAAVPIVTGTVSAATPVNVDRASMRLEVTLQDTSLARCACGTIGQFSLTGAGQALPVPFAIEYDARPRSCRRTPTRCARKSSMSNELKYTSTTAYPVITRDNPTSDLNIVVEPIGTTGAPLGRRHHRHGNVSAAHCFAGGCADRSDPGGYVGDGSGRRSWAGSS